MLLVPAVHASSTLSAFLVSIPTQALQALRCAAVVEQGLKCSLNVQSRSGKRLCTQYSLP